MEVKKFISRFLLFAGINIFLLTGSLLFIHHYENRFAWHNWDTESDISIIPENHNYGLLMMGTSHGRIFSRDNNHQRVEAILHKTMLNISKGNGEGGITPSLIFMKDFYDRGNNASQVVYFIDPWVFYSDKWNDKNFFLFDEPFDLHIMHLCIENSVNNNVLINYVKAKYSTNWLGRKPVCRQENDSFLTEINPEALKKRAASLYLEPYNEKVFAKYAAQLEEIVQIANKHHAKFSFIFPTTLLDDQRGKNKVIALLEQFKAKYGIEYFDYSTVIIDPHLYSDHDHLNTKGVVLFTEKYLKPICGPNN